MMFISGETAQPDPETTLMIEMIVKDQVVEMVRRKEKDHSQDIRKCHMVYFSRVSY